MGYFDIDLGDWGEFSSKLHGSVTSGQLEQVFFSIMKEIAKKSLAIVKYRTPVGVYPAWRSRVGGTLRREWKISTVEKIGDTYTFLLYNNTYYADWVENGHHTTNGGWVEGQFMMELSLMDIEEDMEKIIDEAISKFMSGL